MTGLPIAKLIELLGWHWRPASKDTPLLEPSLPHPEDQLDPRFILHEVHASDGDDGSAERLIESAMQVDMQMAEEESMNVDSSEPESEEERLVGELDDDFGPFDEDSCAGVRDIIITGEVRLTCAVLRPSRRFANGFSKTISRHSDAWHRYLFYGRVRQYDGLIALVRKPVTFPGLGVQIFRGYLVGEKTLVGNWRAFRPNPSEIAQEGPFIASRTNFDG